MITPEKQSVILARIQKIPIFSTLRMGSVSFAAGEAEMGVPRQLMYDGVYQSFHGGILMTIAA